MLSTCKLFKINFEKVHQVLLIYHILGLKRGEANHRPNNGYFERVICWFLHTIKRNHFLLHYYLKKVLVGVQRNLGKRGDL